MVRFLTVLIVAAMASGPVAASDNTTEVTAVVRRWIDNFNTRDPKTVAETCSDQTHINGAVPPYEWRGTGSCVAWANAWEVYAKKKAMTGCTLHPGPPRHIDFSADRAYYVVEAEWTCTNNGKPSRESGWTWSIVLNKGPSGWRMIGWAWGAPTETAFESDR